MSAVFVDSHCHLSSPELIDRVCRKSARRCATADVDRALCICTTLEEFERVHALATGYDNFWGSVGVHPDNEDSREPTVDDLVALAAPAASRRHRRDGLDYFRLEGRSVADMEWQRERFRVHIRGARDDRPAARDPHPQRHRRHAARRCARRRAARAGGVFHCFTETADVARAALDLGFSHFVLGHPDLQERRRAARGRRLRAARSLPDRDRQPVPGAGAVSRQGQHAGATCPGSRASWPRSRGFRSRTSLPRRRANFERLFGRMFHEIQLDFRYRRQDESGAT